MSNEQKKRIQQAIEETNKILKKELSYLEKNQNKKFIELHKNHIKKLEAMLAS